MRTKKIQPARHTDAPFISDELIEIVRCAEIAAGDDTLLPNVSCSPTALSHIKRMFTEGGSIITDTELLKHEFDMPTVRNHNIDVHCFIDDVRVVQEAYAKQVTRAEIAVDYALTVPGLKLFVIGSAPAAIGRLLQLRRREPMTDLCVLAAPAGFAGAVQLKEKLIDSSICSIVIRGKKGGTTPTLHLVNALLEYAALNAGK